MRMNAKIGLLAVFTLALPAGVPAFAQAPACNQAQAPDCLYFPSAHYSFDVHERSISYTDTAGLPREVRVMVRVPIAASAPLPVVVWSHGGAKGKNSPAHSMARWSAVTAAAGYLTVSIAHAARDTGSRSSLCQAIGIAAVETCKVFKHLNWDRPHDIRAVLDADAFHTLFALNAEKCNGPLNVDQAKCNAIVRWLSSAALAFLDAHVRQSPAALQWLQSNRIENASLGAVEWLRK